MITLYQHEEFLEFLSAHIRERRLENPSWSYGAWAKRLGLSGAASITMVLNGQRDPGEKLLQTLSKYFKFNEEEQSYFFEMAELYRNRKDQALQNHFRSRLAERRLNLPDAKREIDLDVFAIVGNWLCYAIREMITIEGFYADLDWIQNRLVFPVSKIEIESALTLLKKTKLIRIENGKWVSDPVTLETPKDIQSAAIRNYHHETLNLGMKALESISAEEREFSSLNLNIKKSDVPRIKKFLQNFQDEFCASSESGSGDEVYQLNLQFFPLTQKAPSS